MKKCIRKLAVVVFIIAMIWEGGLSYIHAQNNLEDSGLSVFSLGENGEAILVKGNKETIGDYGDVEGYEITSFTGTGYVEYRESVHHCMTVNTSQGETVGYCMQPYMNGPGTNAFTDYDYVEGFTKSSIFSVLSEAEVRKWAAVYIIATKYGYGGTKADPNYPGGSNYHDGGTFGTYLVSDDDGIRVVRGLMIGGKVYDMTKGEAMALTQVVVHYVSNRDSEKNITDFKGHTNPAQTSAAFKHLKAYADGAVNKYDEMNNLDQVSMLFDSYAPTKSMQSIKWYVYDYSVNQWMDYTGQRLGTNNMDHDNKVQMKVVYYSKNLCNKLVNNKSTDNSVVVHNYAPFVVNTISNEADYYDYITINNSGQIPVKVTYNMVEAGKESINNTLIGKMQYDIDTFSQTALVEFDGMDLIRSGADISLSVQTGVGSTTAPCYNPADGRYSARMFSCTNVQDCLMIASNDDTRITSSYAIGMDASGTIVLNKVSARTDVTEDNSCYDMSGAIYNVYAVSSNADFDTSNKVGSFYVNEDGVGLVTYSKYNANDTWNGSDETKCILSKLPLGWYMVCEEKAPDNESYILDTNKYYINITAENYKEIHKVVSEETPVADPIPFEIIKQCEEGENVGSATLEGAEFTVWYYKGYYDSYEEIQKSGVGADKEWKFKTQISKTTNNATCIIHEDLLLEGSDTPYLDEDGSMILPLGTIVVKETKAPIGYKLEGATYNLVNTVDGSIEVIDAPFVSKIQLEQGTVKLSVGNKIKIDEEPVRGDLKLVKKDIHTGAAMAGIPFLVTSNTTGESHVIVTDKDGVASTEAKYISHNENTNGNDNYKEEDNLKPTGIWFVGNSNPIDVSAVDDEKGALPYDDYTVTELSCRANEEYYKAKSFQVTISEDKMVIDCGEINNIHKPEIGTDVIEVLDEDKIILAGEKVSVVDKVSYEYLDIEKTYIIKGIIVDKKNGEQLTQEGELLESWVEFKPTEDSGIIDVPFEFFVNGQKGDQLVVYEYLYEKGSEEVIASHEDINCEKQTLTIEVAEVKNEIITPEEVIVSEDTPTTGDSVRVGLIIALMVTAVMAIFGMIYVRKKNRIL